MAKIADYTEKFDKYKHQTTFAQLDLLQREFIRQCAAHYLSWLDGP